MAADPPGTRSRAVAKEHATISATALLTALALAQEHGAEATLRVPALRLDRSDLRPDDDEDMQALRVAITRLLAHEPPAEALGSAVALGFLAGRLTAHFRTRSGPSSFLIDRELLVTGAEGESVLRLPWLEEDLFVGRQIPDIGEAPAHVRNLCIEHYRAGLAGERGRFAFTSYGHSYTVDAVPVESEDGRVGAVLGIARPVPRRREPSMPNRLTAREVEILQLAAYGMSGPEIAEHLVLSPGTVKTHFQNIYEKWGISDRVSAVAEALRQGLID